MKALMILVIGDSIAHGWGPHVTTNIPAENCRGTRQVLVKLDQWAPPYRYWDVIIFNAGLHDVAQGVPLPEYAENLRRSTVAAAMRPTVLLLDHAGPRVRLA